VSSNCKNPVRRESDNYCSSDDSKKIQRLRFLEKVLVALCDSLQSVIRLKMDTGTAQHLYRYCDIYVVIAAILTVDWWLQVIDQYSPVKS
jgi:hypothetical protein